MFLNFYIYLYVLQVVVCPFVLFLLTLVLSALLRSTDSDYSFGIFKPFFPKFYFSTLVTAHITIPHEHVKTSLAEIIHKTWIATLQYNSFGSRINTYRRQNGSGNESRPLHFSLLCFHVPVFYRTCKVWLSRSAL